MYFVNAILLCILWRANGPLQCILCMFKNYTLKMISVFWAADQSSSLGLPTSLVLLVCLPTSLVLLVCRPVWFSWFADQSGSLGLPTSSSLGLSADQSGSLGLPTSLVLLVCRPV